MLHVSTSNVIVPLDGEEKQAAENPTQASLNWNVVNLDQKQHLHITVSFRGKEKL